MSTSAAARRSASTKPSISSLTAGGDSIGEER